MPFAMPCDTSAAVGQPPRVGNRSLLADRYAEFSDTDDDKKARSPTIQSLVTTSFEEGPSTAARRTALAGLPSASVFHATLAARLIVNHAGGVIENAGLALDRNSGAPCIPGSALKGIARAGAALAGAPPAEVALVFGWAPNRNQERDIPSALPLKAFAGSVCFLPAYPLGSASLERDIVTVHHAAYYQGKNHPVAYDDEPPIPNEFPVVRAGVEFQFVLAPASAARCEKVAVALGLTAFNPVALAKEWLIMGLTQRGVGAKTAAGYGWFEYDAEKEKRKAEAALERARAAEEARRQQEEEDRRKSSLSPVDRCLDDLRNLAPEPFASFAKSLSAKTAEEQRAFVLLLKTQSDKKDWWKTKKKRDAALADAIRKVAQTLGEALP